MKYLKIAFGFLLEYLLNPVFIIQALLIFLALYFKSDGLMLFTIIVGSIYTIVINIVIFVQYDSENEYKGTLPTPFFFRLWYLLKSNRFMTINNRFLYVHSGDLFYKGKVYKCNILTDEQLINQYLSIKDEKKSRDISYSSHKIERR